MSHKEMKNYLVIQGMLKLLECVSDLLREENPKSLSNTYDQNFIKFTQDITDKIEQDGLTSSIYAKLFFWE